MLTAEETRAWFFPKTVLAVGASRSGASLANIFVQRQREFGYAGRLFVLHPEADEISGAPCVRDAAEIGEPVDFAYVAVPGPNVPELLARWAGQVRIAQVITSGFRETGPDGRRLEEEMVRVARAGGIRLVGPNCIGTYSPGGGLTLVDNAPPEPGDIGVASQSGVVAADVVKIGGFHGGRFSQVASIGNCADVDLVDVYEHFVADPGTRVIGLYAEDVGRGRAFLDALGRAEGRKPTVLLKGGLTERGQRSAALHTGALASDQRVWRGIAAQFGVSLTSSIEAFAHSLVGLSLWRGRGTPRGRRCCLVGPGGVMSVLGTDMFRDAGLEVPELSDETLSPLGDLRLPPGHSLRNPIDTPVGVLAARGGRAFGEILAQVARSGEVDWFVVHLSLQNLFSYLPDPDVALEHAVDGLLAAATEPGALARWCLVLRTNGDPALEEVRARHRARAAAQRLPVFTRLEDAAAAIADMVAFEEHAARTGEGSR